MIDSSETPAKSLTQHIIIETTTGLFFIISKLSRRPDVQLISIEPQRGSLRYNNVPGIDLFDTVQNALVYLEESGHSVKTKTTACAILGYFALENMGCLLIATKVAAEKMFFGDHIVNAVIESSWIKIPLTYPYPQNKAELKNFETLSSFQVDGLHYYCETLDLTRPFPSSRPPSDYVQEFCWNDWLSKSFANIGMRDWCPVLIQGAFRCKHIPESNMSLSLITRKSNGHPGTRFFARGLNENGHPGNETECEIILWSPQSDNPNSKWCSHVWRRGTVPVWWKSEPKKGVGDPEITVRKEKPFEGCEKYISSLLDTFGQPLYILSLLRTDPTKGELTLSQHYHQALQYVKHFMSIDATILDYDWHANIKQLGNDKTIESFWDITKHPLERVNISEGSMLILPDDDEDLKDCGLPCGDGRRCVFDIKCHQNGVCRFNCADSLDRTNVATFFYCFQILAEMCKRLGSPAFKTEDNNAQWTGFSYDYRTLTKMLESTKLTSPLADFFITSGDISSLLYTNTLASHSGPMREHSSNPSAAPSNTLIVKKAQPPNLDYKKFILQAIQRRYQNMIHDQLRQAQYEMFCGLFTEKYFPSLTSPQLELLSDYPSTTIPTGTKHAIPLDVFQQRNINWTVPAGPAGASGGMGRSTAEAVVMLRAPAEVREIAITFGANGDTGNDPCTLELSVGAYLNALHPVYSGLQLPSPAAPCTQLIYPVPQSLWDIFDENYLKSEKQPNEKERKRRIVRFVKVVLSGPSDRKLPLSISRIDVFGVVPRPSRTPEDTRQLLKAQQIEGKAKALVSLLKTVTLLERYNANTSSSNDASSSSLSSSTNNNTNDNDDSFKGGFDCETPTLCEADVDGDIAVSTASADTGSNDASTTETQLEIQRLRDDLEQQSRPERLSQTFFGEGADFSKPNRMESCLRDYEEAVQAALAGGKGISFTSSLELELTRLNLKLTTAERDTIISIVGYKSQDFSPSSFRYLRDEKLEDQLYQAAPNPQKCCRCGETFKIFSRNYTKCCYCREKVCPGCIHPKTFSIPQYCWDAPHKVCKRCAADIVYQKDCTSKIQAIYDFNNQDFAQRPRSFPEGLFAHVQAAIPEATLVPQGQPCCLSAFPGAGFTDEVPCAEDSAPAEVILVQESLISSSSAFWAAPRGTKSVKFTVCLPQRGAVSSVKAVLGRYGDDYDGALDIVVQVIESPLLGMDGSKSGKATLRRDGDVMACAFADPVEGNAVVFTVSVPHDAGDDAQIRIGKIAVIGKFVQDVERACPEGIVPIAEPISDALTSSRKKSSLSPVYVSKGNFGGAALGGRGWTDISIGPGKGLIQGFSICVEHGEEGASAQVRLLRVSGITLNSRGDPEKVFPLGVFVVPLCKSGTVLSYTFSSAREANVIRIEHYANYGHKDAITVGRLSLFVTKQSK